MNLMPHEYHHREQLRKAAAECVVLLKKDGHFLFPRPAVWHSTGTARAIRQRAVPVPEIPMPETV